MSRDLRKYSQQTNRRLLVGFFALLFIIGDGLIFVIYGQDAALFGLLCLLIGLAPLILIWGILQVMDLVVKRAAEAEERPAKPAEGDRLP